MFDKRETQEDIWSWKIIIVFYFYKIFSMSIE